MSPEGARPSSGLIWETVWPWVIAAAGGLAAAFLPAMWILNSTWKDSLLNKVVAACAIFVAYLLTAATIIPAIEDKVILSKLRSWGYFRYIVDYLRQAIWSSGALLLISILIDPVPRTITGGALFDRVFSAVWWALLLMSIGTVVRATRLLMKMLLAR
jgi:hypothetical protein